MNVSVVVLAKNEEKNIARCLESVKDLSDNIIVINDTSTDKTAEIAQTYHVQVLTHAVNNDFAQQRNWALEQTKHPWVLFVDADEVVTRELSDEIKHLQEGVVTSVSAFFIPRHDFWQGKKITFGEVFHASTKGFPRLVQKNKGQWEGTVHEQWRVQQGTQEHLRKPLHHYPHPTIAEFLEDVNRYSTIRAKELYQQKRPVAIWHICCYPLGKFFMSYFILLGFLNGAQGFIYSFMMSFHSFLVRAKLYQYYHLSPPSP